MHSAVISIRELHERLPNSDLRIVDASWHLPGSGRNARAEYLKHRLPGAVFFDIDEIADRSSPFPHMLPGDDQFAQAVGNMGIGDEDDIVVYDSTGLSGAARVWWTFRSFGHRRVSVLDGGLPGWISEGLPVESGPVAHRQAPYRVRCRADLVSSKAQLIANLVSEQAQVVDARAPGRFYARAPEPRPGLRGGHIPRSINLPYEHLLDDTGRLLPRAGLVQLFAGAGLDFTRPIVTTCGSGITACVVALGLHVAGAGKVSVYDGSWAEWGSGSETPVEAL